MNISTIDMSQTQVRALRTMLNQSATEDDPSIRFAVENMMWSSFKLQTVLHLLRSNSIYFSVLNQNRRHIADKIATNQVPANMFCARSPALALQFIGGHRRPPRVGDSAALCCIVDKQAEPANSPSVIQTGARGASSSHVLTSNSARLICVVQATIVSGQSANVAVSAAIPRKNKGLRIRLGDEADSATKRIMRKIRRKRMDNFGVKGDF